MNGPSGIAIDADDTVYVADQHNHRIHRFSTDGRHVDSWGGPGSGQGEFNMPWGLAVDGQGSVYVADWRNDRVQKFSSDGEFLASFGESGDGDGQFSRPSSVAVDGEGNIYVSDWGNERVQVLGPDGSFLQMLRGEATLSKWAKEFFAANPDEQSTRDVADLIPKLPPHLNTADDASSQIEPYFWGPVSVSLDHQDRLYVAETNRHRFQVYQRA